MEKIFKGIWILLLISFVAFNLIVENRKVKSEGNFKNKQDVQLSFLDFRLGANFEECLSKTQEEYSLEVICQNETRNVYCTIFQEEKLQFSIETYNDTIKKIVLFFNKTLNGIEIDSIFIGKYGKPNKGYLSWDYNNATIELKKEYSSSSEYRRKPGTEGVRLKNFHNAYEKVTKTWVRGVTATYTDKNINEKFEVAESIAKIEKIKADSLELINKNRRLDSIRNKELIDRQVKKNKLIECL